MNLTCVTLYVKIIHIYKVKNKEKVQHMANILFDVLHDNAFFHQVTDHNRLHFNVPVHHMSSALNSHYECSQNDFQIY